MTDEIVEMKTIKGDTVKSLGDNRYGGYLIRFSTASDPDLSGEFFDANTYFGDAEKSVMWFNHRQPVASAKGTAKAIGTPLGMANLKRDDVGVWAEIVMDARTEYEKYIKEMLDAGMLGWSSGTAPHLVDYEPAGKATHIKTWILGLDASLTPTPCEPRNSVRQIKSIDGEDSPIAPDAGDESGIIEAVNAMNEAIQKLNAALAAKKPPEDEAPPENELETEETMNEEEIKSLVIEAVKAAMSTPTNDGGIVTNAKSANVISQRGNDTGKAAFVHWARTGDKSSVLKANPWNESTAADGGVTVPDDYWSEIIEKRDDMSIVRQAGANVIKTSRDKITIPVENAREAIFVATAEETGTYDEANTAPLAACDIALTKYTRSIKVSEELLHDSASNIEAFLMSRLARAAALTENSIFLVGSGDGDPDPEGIFVGGTAALTLDSASTIGVGEIPELYHKLPSAYVGPGLGWVMRNATLGVIRSLVHSAGGFAYQNNPAGQLNGGLEGAPVYLSDYAVAIAASAKSVILGNFNYYTIVESTMPMTVSRNPYLYQANGQVGFFANIRIGGAVTQAEAFVYATHPSA